MILDRHKGWNLIGVGYMRGLNNPFPAPGVDNVHRQFGLGPPSLLLREREAL